MPITPLKRGRLPSSTPVQLMNDSGYFGSCEKSPFSKVVQALSPIKEFSPLKKRLNNLVEFAKDVGFKRSLFFTSCAKSKPDIHLQDSPFRHDAIKKQLNFSFVSDSFQGCNLSNSKLDSSQLTSVPTLDYIKPSNEKVLHLEPISDAIVKDHNNNSDGSQVSLVKVKPLNKKVDVLGELRNIDCTHIISSILSYVSAKDLCKVSLVSTTWHQLVKKDRKANYRKRKYLKRKESKKENLNTVTRLDSLESCRQALCDIANDNVSKQPLVKPCSAFESFLKEGRNLGTGKLIKCPSCKYAAKSLSGNMFSCTSCSYVFCMECLGPYLQGHTCPLTNVVEHKVIGTYVGSKKSKKNLKRL